MHTCLYVCAEHGNLKKNSAFVQKEIENLGNNKNENDRMTWKLSWWINFNQIIKCARYDVPNWPQTWEQLRKTNAHDKKER